jgi:hypothetical protein
VPPPRPVVQPDVTLVLGLPEVHQPDV